MVSKVGMNEPVTTTGLSFAGTFVSCAMATVATITEPTKPSGDALRRVACSCRFLLIEWLRLVFCGNGLLRPLLPCPAMECNGNLDPVLYREYLPLDGVTKGL